jgi:hypothetical protein
MVGGQPKLKVRETPISINKKMSVVVCVCHPSYKGSTDKRTVVQASPGINARSYLKNNKSEKKGWRCDLAGAKP